MDLRYQQVVGLLPLQLHFLVVDLEFEAVLELNLLEIFCTSERVDTTCCDMSLNNGVIKQSIDSSILFDKAGGTKILFKTWLDSSTDMACTRSKNRGC